MKSKLEPETETEKRFSGKTKSISFEISDKFENFFFKFSRGMK